MHDLNRSNSPNRSSFSTGWVRTWLEAVLCKRTRVAIQNPQSCIAEVPSCTCWLTRDCFLAKKPTFIKLRISRANVPLYWISSCPTNSSQKNGAKSQYFPAKIVFSRQNRIFPSKTDNLKFGHFEQAFCFPMKSGWFCVFFLALSVVETSIPPHQQHQRWK